MEEYVFHYEAKAYHASCRALLAYHTGADISRP